ncbi:MMPL family transporter [Chromobacterium vaccinii]|uniref:MMPL family transporter n=1 Tax=Chromobacterium vaccinii TaxID=1108595 RepID=UPI003C70AF12
MTELGGPSRAHRWLAAAWLALLLVVAGHNGWLWLGGGARLETDILAMLPQNRQDTAAQDATRQLADAGARRVVALLGASGWNDARRAADAYAAAIGASGLPLALRYRIDARESGDWLGFYAGYRAQLLGDDARHRLANTPVPTLAEQAAAALFQPVGMPRQGRWQDDPLNLYGQWLGERASQSKVRVRDDRLSLSDGDQHYALVMLEQQGPAFSVSAQQAMLPALAKARQAALAAAPSARVIEAGIPLFAAAASTQAEREVHTIGAGSLLGILLLTVLAFNGVRPRILVTLSIVAGLGCAVSLTMLLFGKLHLITLVFGASLIGVAENYGNNYYAYRLGRPAGERWAMLRGQRSTMWLAFATTAIGYGLLALAPFPGLRQMAVFSVTGLFSAFATVLCCLPFADRGEMPFNGFSQAVGNWRRAWPRWGRNRFTILFAVCAAVICLAGLVRLQANDDVRALQNAPRQLLEDQRLVGELMQMAGPGQFFLVSGASPEQVLQREEALKARLAPLIAAGKFAGVQAISDWVPSESRQTADRALLQRVVFAPGGVLEQAAGLLGQAMPSPSLPPLRPLTIDAWLAAPVSEPLRAQWLGRFGTGYASVVMLRGLAGPAALPALAAAAPAVAGVRFIDKVGEISGLMRHYRQLMTWVIAASYLLVLAMLWRRFGRRAWRALLPTLLASVLTVALLALFGQPLQLFTILALLLILGMGVDYGVFLLADADPRAFLSVTLAAAGTLLAFGLLALSSTPALAAFGLTMLLGISLCWLLNPLLTPSI